MNMCDDGTGTGSFNLTLLEDSITSEDYDIEWHENISGTSQVSDPSAYISAGASVYAIVTDENGDCPTSVEVPLTIGEVEVTEFEIDLCVAAGSNGALLDLTSLEDSINSSF